MKVFTTRYLVKSYIQKLKEDKLTVGLVATMGALHKGHLSLIQQAKKLHDIVVVSIFVNPTQFNNVSDLEKYPRTLESDLEKLKSVDCDIVFTPNASEMYPENEEVIIFDFQGLDKEMEGKFRENHFNGVGTIVKKLFETLLPNSAYFGEKDFQQLQIIKKLTQLTNLDVNIVGCSIYREKDGLAMSSRNTRLNKEHRESAPFIYKTLQEAALLTSKLTPLEIEKYVSDKFKKHSNLTLEYFTISDEENLKPVQQFHQSIKTRGFIAVFAGEIRLIDNIALY